MLATRHRPDYLELAPEMRRDILVNMEGLRSGAVSIDCDRPYEVRLFGIPIRVNQWARGFQWAPGGDEPPPPSGGER